MSPLPNLLLILPRSLMMLSLILLLRILPQLMLNLPKLLFLLMFRSPSLLNPLPIPPVLMPVQLLQCH